MQERKREDKVTELGRVHWTRRRWGVQRVTGVPRDGAYVVNAGDCATR